MEPRVTLITLAVADLERALEFYRDGLGWPTEGIVGQDIENGAVVSAEGTGTTGFELAHNVRSKEEVDEVVALARAAGATVTSPPADQAWGGYAAHFQDPDGHLWEIAWNPDPRFAID